MPEEAIQLVKAYYDAFNRDDKRMFFDLLDEHIIHDINQGLQEIGKPAFKKFMDHMSRCYNEKITDLVVLTNHDGSRAAAEFIVNGNYIATDSGFPEAKNQSYIIQAGAFFVIKASKITRVTNYYNVNEWVKIISTIPTE